MEDIHVDKGSSLQEDSNVNDNEYSTKANNVYNINKNFAFEIGMKFSSEEESYNAYNSYALAKGFGVRKSAKTYNINKEVTRRLFLCACEGKSDKLSLFQERKHQRLEYRCGCMTRIKFKILNGIWKVCEFNDVHSHPMIEDNLKHFIQSDRKLTSATKSVFDSMVDVGIRKKQMVRYLHNEAGGIENAGFIEQDAHNFIQAHKRNMISDGDAQTMINQFMHLQSEDSNFFYSFQVDEDGRFLTFYLGQLSYNVDANEKVFTRLDECPNESVLYVAFGSQKLLTKAQMDALTIGLEKSGVRFILVAKQLSAQQEKQGFGLVPQGFEERVLGRGLVIKGWAPQVEILGHRAVGGFLSHCEWNSILEAIVAGVLILGWPMETDQFTNTWLLVDNMKMSIRVCEGANSVPVPMELSRRINEAMSNDLLKERVKKMRDEAYEAVKIGGSSKRGLDSITRELAQLKS